MKLLRALANVLLALCSPILLGIAAAVFAATDLLFAIFGEKKAVSSASVQRLNASIVIPNWNGRDLLEIFLPSVLAAVSGNPENEILVVDNASTDGSTEFLRENFPSVRVLSLPTNLGFGGGSNTGFGAAKNDIVVLLNNDMRVERDFLSPLLEAFTDPLMFSASCQIFFSDPKKLREETGLTQTWWEHGKLRVQHRMDDAVDRLFPCAYPGGGSSAFDRRKFLELGGFDELYRPFYYEDTDLGIGAWKRGWKVMYQPRSVVFHEHRGTIGRKFSRDYINSIVKKNAVLYTWKNNHDWRSLGLHFLQCAAASFCSPIAVSAANRATATGTARAFAQIGQAVHSRWNAKQLAAVSDAEALLRQQAGYFRDRFEAPQTPTPRRLQVLFLSPYPIEPTTHGGAVFMRNTLAALQPLADVHLLSFLDNVMQVPAQQPLQQICASTQFRIRTHRVQRSPSDPSPRVIREFTDREFDWMLQRTLYLKKIDVLQVEYTILAQYLGSYRHLPRFLFEHDISFQSMGRRMKAGSAAPNTLGAYLQLLRYELQAVRRADRVQVCSRENAEYLLEFAPELEGRIDANLRAVIDPRDYRFVSSGREPDTLLFAGSFNHLPNTQGLLWFLRKVFPQVLQKRPNARLIVAGSGNPKTLRKELEHRSVEWKGFVPHMRNVLEQYAVLICPVLSGSGVRVKLLEAFAAGIPVVSTSLGAEGLTSEAETVCEIGDSPQQFATACVRLLTANDDSASTMASRARRFVQTSRDAVARTVELESIYRLEVQKRRP